MKRHSLSRSDGSSSLLAALPLGLSRTRFAEAARRLGWLSHLVVTLSELTSEGLNSNSPSEDCYAPSPQGIEEMCREFRSSDSIEMSLQRLYWSGDVFRRSNLPLDAELVSPLEKRSLRAVDRRRR